ncbi:glycosyltransferase family 4 protein [Bacillus alkalicellulosilyticus]|uniref:glycosyltransferase family 4 protein n=1 Tax=Alkalihalobacterium alkalicellulosilyticum TaxID=1912214 RepID=UPI000997EB6F|nr:glycosyltransferase family 4 protein [Bacillus alkalicellulosilyticus]
MPKKILFIATVDYHFNVFHLPVMKWFKEQGWDVHIAAAGEMELPFTDKKHSISIQRSPFSVQNVKALFQLKNIIKENQYDIVHCHTPLGGVLGRLAASTERKNGLKVIYTAHGFHFCKGAPKLNWFIYYPIEKGLAYFTDTLITINEEDYALAKEKEFKAQYIEHVHGVGIDPEKFQPIDEKVKKLFRKKYGYRDDEILLYFAAEFNKNKNQIMLLKALDIVKEKVPKVRLIFCGEGPMLQDVQAEVFKLALLNWIDFLGYRNDIDSLVKMSDIGVSASYREGLPVNIMEAMSCGLPVVATENRGHLELISDGENGFIIEKDNVEQFAERIIQLAKNEELRRELGQNGRKLIESKYTSAKIVNKLKLIYQKHMKKKGESKWATQ